MIARLRRLIAGLLIVSIAGLGLPLPARAGIVSTGAGLASAERDISVRQAVAAMALCFDQFAEELEELVDKI